MWSSKLGCEFRQYMDLWEENEKKNQVRMMIDGQNMVLFFIYKNELYGTQEPHRVTFAKMKNPNPDEQDEGWGDDANFMATNLTRAIVGKPTQHMFKKFDIMDIEVIPKEECYEILDSISDKVPSNVIDVSNRVIQQQSPKDKKVLNQEKK